MDFARTPEHFRDGRAFTIRGSHREQEPSPDISRERLKRKPTPHPRKALFSEFQHLAVPNSFTHTEHNLRRTPSYYHSGWRPETATPSTSASWETMSRANTSSPYDEAQQNMTPIQGSPTLPEPYASTEPYLSTPVNAMIRGCYRSDSRSEAYQIASIGSTCTTPDIPMRSHRRPIPNGREIGELFNHQWGSRISEPERSDQHLEVEEWIKLLREKADMVVESVQEPLPSLRHQSRSSSPQNECEKASQPYRCPYLVMRLVNKGYTDGIHIWKRILHHTTPLSSFFAVVSSVLYFVLRILYTVSARQAAGRAFALSWVFIVAEMAITIPAILCRSLEFFVLRSRNRDKIRLISDFTPTVDVFITCCNEDNVVILDTIRATLAISWPISRFRVVVLDDSGTSSSLLGEIEHLSKTFPNLYYTTRTREPGVQQSKVGNLNYGLQFVTGLKGGPGEFCAMLNADTIPESDWLRALIAHIVIDADMALACPPQLFHDTSTRDALSRGLHSSLPSRGNLGESTGIAWYASTGYVVRRCALDEIGGFPTKPLAEDICTSGRLLGAGWNTTQIQEPLQFSRIPDTFQGHIKQRARLTIGEIQTAKQLNFFAYGPLIRHMTFLQRLCGFLHAISPFLTTFGMLVMLVIPLGLLSGQPIVAFANHQQLRWLIRAFFLVFLLDRINRWTLSLPFPSSAHRQESRAPIWMAPYRALAIIHTFFLPKCLGDKAPLSIFAKRIHSISPAHPKTDPLGTRLRTTLLHNAAILHLLYISLCLAALATSLARAIRGSHSTDSPSTGPPTDSPTFHILVSLITHIFWAPLLAWMPAALACWVPIGHAIWPSTVGTRRKGRGRSENDMQDLRLGREEWGAWDWVDEGMKWAVGAFSILVFVASWIW